MRLLASLILVTSMINFSSCSNCNKLNSQIFNGKWRNYDHIDENCLVKLFTSESSDPIDFYPLLSALENQTNFHLNYYDEQINNITSSLKSKSIKDELSSRAELKLLKRQRLGLDRMIEAARVQTSVIETEIREVMDRCLKVANRGGNFDERCLKEKQDILSRTKDLCDYLRAKRSLLLTDKFVRKYHVEEEA